jgi:hypothetical protein
MGKEKKQGKKGEEREDEGEERRKIVRTFETTFFGSCGTLSRCPYILKKTKLEEEITNRNLREWGGEEAR